MFLSRDLNYLFRFDSVALQSNLFGVSLVMYIFFIVFVICCELLWKLKAWIYIPN